MRNLFLFLALLLTAVPTLAQQPNASPAASGSVEFKDVLYGNVAPLTLKLKDLNGEWRCVNLTGSSEASGMMGMFASMFGGGSGTVYYTKGQAVSAGGETFIIAYHAQLKQPNFMEMIMEGAMSGNSTKEPDFSKMKPEKLSPESTLTLSLLNLKTVGTLSNIRPFDMQAEIAASGSSGNGLMDLMMLGAAADAAKKDKGATPAKPLPKPKTKHPANSI